MDRDAPAQSAQMSTTPRGFKTYYEPSDKDSTTDIVAVPGFAVHPEASWTCNDNDGFNWLRDADGLQKEFPLCRILLYQYNSRHRGPHKVDKPLKDIASEFVFELQAERVTCPNRPMVFLAHSMGGLLVAQALVLANDRHCKSFYDCFSACIFFGTPFHGTNAADLAVIYANVRNWIGEGWYTSLLGFMRPDNINLRQLIDDMRRWENHSNPSIRFFCIYEDEKTDFSKFVKHDWLKPFVKKLGSKLPNDCRIFVPELSSTLEGIDKHGIPRCHADLVRFTGADDDIYRKVVLPKLRAEVDEARDRVSKRMSSTQDDSSLAETYFHVPRRLVPYFCGREKILRELAAVFNLLAESEGRQTPVIVLHAMGGQGKSQIALEFCRTSQERYHGVFWIDAASVDTVESAYQRMALLIDPSSSSSMRSPEADIRIVVSKLAKWEKRWLLVFDNWDQPDACDIRRFIPNTGHGSVLVTSRHETSTNYATTAPRGARTVFNVPSMENDGALDLLTHRIGPSLESDADDSDRTKLVKHLGGLALAIDQASAYMRRHRLDVRQFLQEYERRKKEILKMEVWQLTDGYTEEVLGPAITAYTTWQLSFDQISPDDKTQKERITHFLSVCAFLQPSCIGAYIFREYCQNETETHDWVHVFAGSTENDTVSTRSGSSDEDEDDDTEDPEHCPRWDHDCFFEIVRDLEDIALVQNVRRLPDESGTCFTIHPVIRDWLQMRMLPGQRKKRLQEAVKILGAVVRTNFAATATLEVKRRLLDHVDLLASHLRSPEYASILQRQEVAKAATSFGFYYHQRGQHHRTILLLEHTVNIQESKATDDNPVVFAAQLQLARAYRANGQIRQSINLLKRIIPVQEEKHGSHDSELLASQHELGRAFVIDGRTAEAIEIYEHVVNIKALTLSTEDPLALASKHELGRCYVKDNQTQKAVALLEHVVHSRKASLPRNHPSLLACQHGLAGAYLKNGQMTATIELLTHIVSVQKVNLEEDHPTLLASQHALGEAYRLNEEHAKAKEIIEHVSGKRARLNESHPERLKVEHSLALVHRQAGNINQAVVLLEHVVKIRSSILSESHPYLLDSQYDLGETYRAAGFVAKAVEQHEHVVKIRDSILAEDHPDRSKSLRALMKAREILPIRSKHPETTLLFFDSIR